MTLTDKYVEAMQKDLDNLNNLSKTDSLKAKQMAKENLMRVGIIDEAGQFIYPYNGEEPRGDDFSMGPGEITYKQRRR